MGALPILFVSGYADRLLESECDENTALLPKPFRLQNLLVRVGEMLPPA